jgi:hypothetical protein
MKCESAAQAARDKKRPTELKNKKAREWVAANRSRVHFCAFRLRCRQFGLADKDIEALWERAKTSNCEICGRPASDVGRLRPDHCHAVNVFRGLLCDSCNLGLGKFADDPARLSSAITYLMRPHTASGTPVPTKP